MQTPPRVPLSHFSQPTRKALQARNIGNDGFVYPSDMEGPLRSMLDNTLQIKTLDQKLRPRLTALGSTVDTDILHTACDALDRKTRRTRARHVAAAIAAAIVTVLLVTAMAALLWLLVQLRKSFGTHDSLLGSVLVDRTTARALQTADTDFTVLHNALVDRQTNTAIATAIAHFPTHLNTDMDPHAFTAIASLTLGNVYAKVHAAAVLPLQKHVLFFTDYGRIVLKGTRLFIACATTDTHDCDAPYKDAHTIDILADAFATDSRRADPVRYDPFTGMDTQGNCVVCTLCSCL